MAERVPLRLVALAALFELAPLDLDIVLACLAPELDVRYERLYGYLHDDPSRGQPSAALLADLFCPDLASKVEARRRISASAPLHRHGLLQPGPGQWGEALRLEPRIVRFLLEDDEVDHRLDRSVTLVAPTTRLTRVIAPDGVTRQLTQIIEHVRDDGEDLLLYLHGPSGVGRRTVAEACCAELGYRLLVVDGGWLAGRDEDELRSQVRLIDREARLQGALLYWKDFDRLVTPDRRALLDAVLPVLDAHPGPTFLSGEAVWDPGDAVARVAFLRLELPPPGYAERHRLWTDSLDDEGVDVGELDVGEVANAFRLNGAQIRAAAATARNLARARRPAAPLLTRADLTAACRMQSNQGLADLAQKLSPRYGWDDIVLPADQLAQLHEIADHLRHRTLVHEAWGFDAKLTMGKGVNVLFTGAPGTGKTMAADVLACTLGLDLYRIDLSMVVSKYVGETERNLARIFAEADTSNAVLFFDEADALFGRRTQVRDAHDRYANIEISYLLQRIEEYEGLVILASNMRRNIDEAFVRRLHFLVELPLPDAAGRRRIWERIWPASIPRDPDLDLDLLATCEVSGGNIRNIALAGAFLAAADGGVVAMRHVLAAVRREYQKIGKVLTGVDFGVDPARLSLDHRRNSEGVAP
jgi:SpoVK/Ycf46/Vps4 family AAA+-type ATPase